MRKSFLRLHAAIFLAGFTGILGRLITLNEGLLVWYRMLFSTAGLFLLAYFSRNRLRVAKGGLLPILAVGAIVAFHWVCFYGSIKYSNVSISLVCFSAVGFFTALLDPLISQRRVDPAEVFLGLLVMGGIALIFHFDSRYQTGIILGIASSLLAALFTTLNKRLLQKHGADVVTFYEMTGGWAVLTLLLPAYLAVFPADHLLPTLPDLERQSCRPERSEKDPPCSWPDGIQRRCVWVPTSHQPQSLTLRGQRSHSRHRGGGIRADIDSPAREARSQPCVLSVPADREGKFLLLRLARRSGCHSR
jgi:hypothetical protein